MTEERFIFDPKSDDHLDATRMVGEWIITLRADRLRRERTGLHGRVAFGVNETVYWRDTINIDKGRPDRHDFANYLYGPRGKDGVLDKEIADQYPQNDFEHEFMLWAGEVWDAWVGSDTGAPDAWDASISERIDWVLEPYILHEGGTVIFAPPKSVKSFTTMLWAVSVDAGVSTYWKVSHPRRVLWVNLERGREGVLKRLRRINRVLDLPETRPLTFMHRRGNSLADILDSAQRTIKEQGIEVVFLDSLTRGGFGNLNGNEEANKAMDALNLMCPTWVAIGHTPYEDDSKLFGSQMFRAAYDIGVNLRTERKNESTVGAALLVKDTNDVPPAPLSMFAYEFEQEGLIAVRKAARHEFPALESEDDSPRSNKDRVYDQMFAHGEMSISRMATDLRMNKRAVSDAVDSLLADGHIVNAGKKGREILFKCPSLGDNVGGNDNGRWGDNGRVSVSSEISDPDRKSPGGISSDQGEGEWGRGNVAPQRQAVDW